MDIEPGIEYLTWYDISGFPYTQLQTLLPIEWVPVPEEVTDSGPVQQQTVVITSTINAASWEPSTREIVPTIFTAYFITETKDEDISIGQPQSYTGKINQEEDIVEARSYFPDAVEVSAGKAKIGVLMNGILYNVSCEELNAPQFS